jgi:hypothetical protein
MALALPQAGRGKAMRLIKFLIARYRLKFEWWRIARNANPLITSNWAILAYDYWKTAPPLSGFFCISARRNFHGTAVLGYFLGSLADARVKTRVEGR